jgi:branched-chain amino acid transport system ATP-binding protein
VSIKVRDVTVRFGGVIALSKVSLTLEPGTIVSVVGPNGSGKSTLFNSVSGLVRLAEGAITIGGHDIRDYAPYRRVTLGLARTFQTPRFDPRESVERAVLCGFYPQAQAGLLSTMLRLPVSDREEEKLLASCHRILRDLNLFDLRDTVLGELSMGQVRLVEVARAIANEPKYLLLDEPAAGLSRHEQQILAEEVKRLARAGVGVLLVEHNFHLVRELAGHVVVLDRGKMLLEGLPREIEVNPEFVSLYLGNAAKAM